MAFSTALLSVNLTNIIAEDALTCITIGVSSIKVIISSAAAKKDNERVNNDRVRVNNDRVMG